MNHSLPGIYLYHLPSDNLPPEQFERIISANLAWSRICREYEFDNRHTTGRYLINMREAYTPQRRTGSHGTREKDKLEKMVFAGEVVMLNNLYGPANLFHINNEGQLICTDTLAFRFEGAKKIIVHYDQSVRKRDYRTTNGKPRSTQIRHLRSATNTQPERSTLTRAADESGRVLSAKWHSLTDSAKTLWEATPFTHDKTTTEAARNRIAEGAIGTLEGLATLMGPSPEEYMAGALNPELAALNTTRQQNQQAAVQAIHDNTKKAVTDAYDRNGLAGATAMIATVAATELAGTKGLGTVEKVGTLGDAAKLGKAVELEKLDSYLGTYKGKNVLLKNVDVVKMDYVRRSPAERDLLRREFDSSIRKNFLKDIADNPEVVKRLDTFDRNILAKGFVPDGYQVHHKLPLDDSGDNSFDNLVLISTRPEHAAFTTAQKRITASLNPTGTNIVLWPKPQGIIYP